VTYLGAEQISCNIVFALFVAQKGMDQMDQLSRATSEGALLSMLRPSRAQTTLAAALAMVLVAALFIAIPLRSVQLPELSPFIPIVDTTLWLSGVITATLLFAQVSVVRSRAMLVLATGYLFTGLIPIPHLLTYPGAFFPAGLLGAGVNTSIWLYFFWHGGLPIAVIVYGGLKTSGHSASIPVRRVQRATFFCIVGSVALVIGLTAFTTRGHSLFPVLMVDDRNWSSARADIVAAFPLVLQVIAMAVVWRGQRSVLDLWLLVALLAWSIELVLVMATSSRYSFFWYAGRSYGLLAGVVVLLFLLSETTRVYSRLALSLLSRELEKEAQVLSMQALSASIAHEIKQPIAAVVANADAGLRWLDRENPEIEQASKSLKLIKANGHRVAGILNSIRTIFGKQRAKPVPVNLNVLVRDVVRFLDIEVVKTRTSLVLQLDETLPVIMADPLQMQQVFINLLTNALEALRAVHDRDRLIVIRSRAIGSDFVQVSVEDNGSGIDAANADRVFDAFFTTKQEGAGMGLFLCRSIIESHRGTLSVAHGESFGTVFHVRLARGEMSGDTRAIDPDADAVAGMVLR